jgi:ABC-type transport system involved in multi-copper enzyme maturation permease subunit
MRLQLPHALGGPVLHWELVRAARHPWLRVLHYGFIAWILLQSLGFVLDFRAPPQPHQAERDYDRSVHHPALENSYTEWMAQVSQVTEFVWRQLHQQLLFLVLLTPALTAGALGYEREKDTLTALLGTQLQAREIVLGKLLGRLALLLRIALVPLPILLIAMILADQAPGRVLLALVQATVLTFSLTTACMLLAVWMRRTSDAILACYAIMILVYLASEVLIFNFSSLAYLDPLKLLTHLTTPNEELALLAFVLHVFVWFCVGLGCLVLAVRQLRRACLYQAEHRPPRWLWAFRPRVSGNPVRWRERYILGLAPLPILRIVPVWMGMLGVLVFSTILVLSSLSPVATNAFFRAVLAGQFDFALQVLRTMILPIGYGPLGGRVASEISAMGVILVLAAILVVGARCASSIAEEKRRKTWEDLLLTALTLDEIVRSKRVGVIQAALPYLVMYALPMIALGTLGGAFAISNALLWFGASCLATVAAAWVGSEIAAGDNGPPPVSEEMASDLQQVQVMHGWGPE